MKKLLGIFAAVVLLLTLAACGKTADEGTVLSIDVNPSIEIIFDADDIVTSVALLNEDAKIALANVTLEGLGLDAALNKITEALIDSGHINVDTDENIIIITVTDETKEAIMKEKVEQILANHYIGAAVFGGEMLDAYHDLAEEYDIGVGRARLISRAVEIDGVLTFEEALELEHSEIMTILREEHRTKMDAFIAQHRANAQHMQEGMHAKSEAHVQAHYDKVDEGMLEAPDFDEIRTRVENDIERIRLEYQQRIEQLRE